MRRRILPLIVLSALALATLLAPVAFAAYPPGPFPGAAPGGAFSTVLASSIVCAEGGTLNANAGASAVTVTVPPAAFATCTQVTIYGADRSVIAAALPPGAHLVAAFAVGWQDVSAQGFATVASTAVALTLSIDDAAITSGATAYRTTSTGVAVFTSASVAAGSASFSFADPTGVAVSMPGAQPTTKASLPPTSTLDPAPPDDAWPALPLAIFLAGSATALFFIPRPRRGTRS